MEGGFCVGVRACRNGSYIYLMGVKISAFLRKCIIHIDSFIVCIIH